MENQIKATISKILSHQFNMGNTTNTTLEADADLIRDYGLNSLNLLQFIVSMEKEFGIDIDIEKLDLKYFNNLSLLTTFIKKNIEEKTS